jgi:hypothetical protein
VNWGIEELPYIEFILVPIEEAMNMIIDSDAVIIVLSCSIIVLISVAVVKDILLVDWYKPPGETFDPLIIVSHRGVIARAEESERQIGQSIFSKMLNF